jgi:integrase
MRHAYLDHQWDSTYLHRDQLAEAAKTYKLIGELTESTGKHYTLLGIVERFTEQERLASKSVTLDRLIDEYTTARKSTTQDYVQSIKSLKDRLPSLMYKVVSNLTPRDIETAVRSQTASVRNLHLRSLRAMCNWGIKKGYLETNPVAKMEFSTIELGEVKIYTPDDVQKLLDDSLEHDLALLPYRVFSIFCGIRPRGEMGRLTWDDVNWADRVVKLRAGITKKGRARFPVIEPNAMAWLEEYRARGASTEGIVVPYSESTLDKKLLANHRRTGVKSAKNAARHSYCSYHLAHFNDINGLTLQSGHANTQTLWDHYYQAARREDAERYWSIVPKVAATNVVAFNA